MFITIQRSMSEIIPARAFPDLAQRIVGNNLLKSMVGIMSVEWMTNVRDNESVSGSYNLYETASNKTWMSANISLESVAYQWKHASYRKRGLVLKQCEFNFQNCHFRFFENLY